MSFKRFRFLLLMLLVAASSCTREASTVQRSTSFNDGWEFVIPGGKTSYMNWLPEGMELMKWKKVSLPHTPEIEPLVMKRRQWQGTAMYRKSFQNPDPRGTGYVALRFEGAMHLATVWLNGEMLKVNTGGYLPFVVDLSGRMKEGENTLIVMLSNTDNPRIPPGKPIDELDFNYYGGLYRDVELITGGPVRITDPVEVQRAAGGGVYITHDRISAEEVAATFRVDVANDGDDPVTVGLSIKMADGTPRAIWSEKEIITIEPGMTGVVEAEVKIDNPELWSPYSPSLYTFDVGLTLGGKVIDRREVTTGFRTIEFDNQGFVLNGERLKIRGTNRHQEYPYVGYAIGRNADYRDARRIKDAGFNFVRLSHYPHSEDFMDACDRLGLLVMDAIPGWQFVGDSVFMENSRDDLRGMIRRDRNHPSVILWEASLNESGMPAGFMADMHRITKEELPGRDAFTCGWIDTIYDVFIPARQHAQPPHYWNGYDGGRPLFIAEYGDWEYYAQNAGFNQAEFSDLLPGERTSRQLRGDGQRRLAQQALNFQEAHNDNLNGTHIGDANWLMFDYNRGYAPDIESSGIMDIFRLPKFAYWFYRSQVEQASGDTVLFIANYWDDPGYTDFRVYSNCDSVEILLNGRSVASAGPDRDNYSTNLLHPPFTFKGIAYEPGKLEAVGYVSGIPVAHSERVTPGSASALVPLADLQGYDPVAGEQDIIIIHASVVDANGNTVHISQVPVTFTVEGPGVLVGDNPAVAEAGIASVLLRTGSEAGTVTVTASSEGLAAGSVEIEIKRKR